MSTKLDEVAERINVKIEEAIREETKDIDPTLRNTLPEGFSFLADTLQYIISNDLRDVKDRVAYTYYHLRMGCGEVE